MKEVNIDSFNDMLHINKGDAFHVLSMEVFTGMYTVETDCIEITSNNQKTPELVLKSEIIRKEKPLLFETRGELGVRIFIKAEGADDKYVITISHHRGGLLVKAHEVPSEMV